MNFEKKTASVEYEPDKTTLGDVMASLMRTNQYTSKLDAPVATTFVTGEADFSVKCEKASHAPDSDGKLLIVLGFKGETKGDPKMSCTAADGLTLTPEGGDMNFHVGKDVKDGEYQITVHVEYAGAAGTVKVDLPGVVIVGK